MQSPLGLIRAVTVATFVAIASVLTGTAVVVVPTAAADPVAPGCRDVINLALNNQDFFARATEWISAHVG